jgi:hypothetical protein
MQTETETETPRPIAVEPTKPRCCCHPSILFIIGFAAFAITAVVLGALIAQSAGLIDGTVSSASSTAPVYQFTEKESGTVRGCSRFERDRSSTSPSCDGTFDPTTQTCRCPPPEIRSESIRFLLVFSVILAASCGVGAYVCRPSSSTAAGFCSCSCRSTTVVSRYDADLSNDRVAGVIAVHTVTPTADATDASTVSTTVDVDLPHSVPAVGSAVVPAVVV